MSDFLDELMGMTDDRAAARRVLESRAPWDTQAACDLVFLNNHVLSEERMSAWINMGEAAFVGKSEEDKDETQRKHDERERLQQEDYERRTRERRAAEEAENARRRQVATRIPGILQALGYGQISAPENSYRGIGYYGTNPEGKQIEISLSNDRTGRRDVFMVHVGKYPTEKEQGNAGYTTVYGANGQMSRPSIAMSPTKTDDQVVRDIQRRFIPAFDAFWAAAKTQAAKRDKSYDTTIGALKLIKGKPLDDHETRSKEVSIHSKSYDVMATIKASNDRVSMHISGLTPEQAKKIKEIMLGKKKPVEESMDGMELQLDDVSVEQAREILGVIDAEVVSEAFELAGKSEEDKEATLAKQEAEREAARKREEERIRKQDEKAAKEQAFRRQEEKNKKMFPRFCQQLLAKAGLTPKPFSKSHYGNATWEGSNRAGLTVEIVYDTYRDRLVVYAKAKRQEFYSTNFWLGDERVKRPESWINAGYPLKTIEDKFLNEFMPKTTVYLEKYAAYLEQEKAKATAEENLLASVKGSTLTPTEKENEELHFRGTGLEGQVRIQQLDRKTLNIDVNGATPEQAAKIYAFLKTFKKEVKESAGETISLKDLTVEMVQEILKMLGPVEIAEAFQGKTPEDKAETQKKMNTAQQWERKRRINHFRDFVYSANNHIVPPVNLLHPFRTYILSQATNPEGIQEVEFCNAAENHLTTAGYYVYNSDSRFEVYTADDIAEATNDWDLEPGATLSHSLAMEPEDADPVIAMFFEDWDEEEDEDEEEIEEALSGKSPEDKEATRKHLKDRFKNSLPEDGDEILGANEVGVVTGVDDYKVRVRWTDSHGVDDIPIVNLSRESSGQRAWFLLDDDEIECHCGAPAEGAFIMNGRYQLCTNCHAILNRVNEALSGKSPEDKAITKAERDAMTDDEKIARLAHNYGYSGMFALISRKHLDNARHQLDYSKKIKDKFGVIVTKQLIQNRMAYDKAAAELGIELSDEGKTLDEAVFMGKSRLDKMETAKKRSTDVEPYCTNCGEPGPTMRCSVCHDEDLCDDCVVNLRGEHFCPDCAEGVEDEVEESLQGKSKEDKEATAATRTPEKNREIQQAQLKIDSAIAEGPGGNVDYLRNDRTVDYLGRDNGDPRFEYNDQGLYYYLLDMGQTLRLLTGDWDGQDYLKYREYSARKAKRLGDNYNPGFDLYSEEDED